MLLMIDNYDSFTYNIVHYCRELGSEVHVYRNDQITLTDIERMQPKQIILSPGPCTPNEAGISLAILEQFSTRLPILGICLGHQCIGQYFGGEIIQAAQIMHGKTSLIYHHNTDIFHGLANPFRATRYHSLVIKPSSLPETLTTTAWTQTEDSTLEAIMGIKHQTYPVYGVQFHPESILTEHGHQLLANFLKHTA